MAWGFKAYVCIVSYSDQLLLPSPLTLRIPSEATGSPSESIQHNSALGDAAGPRRIKKEKKGPQYEVFVTSALDGASIQGSAYSTTLLGNAVRVVGSLSFRQM